MTGDDRATEIVADVRERLDRGEIVDPDDVIRAHPDLAAKLRGRLRALQRLDRAFAKDEAPPAPSLVGRLLGPYRLAARLGTGGMGTVYLASVETRSGGLPLGERVAVKVVHPHLLQREGYFKRFLREAEIGKSVVHENVVRTFDCDAIASGGAQQHFLVMEYVEGQTLRALLAEVERVPEELCRHIGREVAKALAAIHAAGAVHRDLKPDNVLITKENVVKVMDLGVARQDDEALRVSQTGAFVGSVRYAAPEQFKGDAPLDGRADLYALGLVLYELATGVHPFAGDDFHVVLRRQMTETPRPAGEVNPQLSAFFEEVLRTLLAKAADERFASAEDLLDALTHGERSVWWKERAGEARARTKRPLRRVKIPRETALYGRDAELAKLRALFERAKAGDGQVVLVEGEAGIGKSRLVDEFVTGLLRDGEDVNFVFGGYPPGGAATASGAFSTAYREHFGEEGCATWLTQTPLLVPAFDALLRGDAAPTGAEPLTKDSLQTVFVHATRNLAAERPTIVLIDDLHFAPEEGRGLFAALALAVPGHRVLLVGTARPGLPESWTTSVERLAHLLRLALSRLGPKDLARLLVDAFRSERLAEELAFKIGAKSDGNPYFVFEIIRGMREGQLITQRPDGTWATTQVIAEVQVPSTIRDLIAARMSDLSDEEKDLLDVASVVGFEFDASLVADALGVPRIAALKRFARIESRHRLVHSAGERFVFDHHQVQETLYAALPPPLAREWHGAVACAIEHRSGVGAIDPKDLDGAVCVELAEHFLKGGQGARALQYLDSALTHLERGYLNDAALRLIEHALAVPGLVGGRERCELLLREAARFELVGARAAGCSALEEAMRLADAEGAPGLRARARRSLARSLWRAARTDDAIALAREAESLAKTAGDRRTEAAAASTVGVVLRRLGRFDEARTALERSLALAQEIGDRQREGSAMGSLGNVFSDTGRFVEAREFHERHLALSREIGDRHGEVTALGCLGIVFKAHGRLDEAVASYERSRAIAREIGDRRGEAIATGNLGNVLVHRGHFLEARALHERNVALAQENGDRQSQAAAVANLGIVLSSLGRLSEARTHHERHLALSREIGNRLHEAIALGNLGNIYASLGQLVTARETVERALALARAIGARQIEALWLQSRGNVAAEEERFRDAEEAWRAAIAVADQVGDARSGAECRVALGAFLARAGREREAVALLDAARATAREGRVPSVEILALAHLGPLPAGDPGAAGEALKRHAPSMHIVASMDAHFSLSRATGDRRQLVEAKRLLDFLVANAPPDCRESMLANVRLHREITAAAKAAGL